MLVDLYKAVAMKHLTHSYTYTMPVNAILGFDAILGLIKGTVTLSG